MRHYENLVIIKPTLTAEEIAKEVEGIKEVISANGGEIEAVDEIGTRKLAYKIDKNERGYYVVVYYKGKPSSIAEIERKFRINENLLRFLTVKYENKKEIKFWGEFAKKAGSKNSKPSEASEQEA